MAWFIDGGKKISERIQKLTSSANKLLALSAPPEPPQNEKIFLPCPPAAPFTTGLTENPNYGIRRLQYNEKVPEPIPGLFQFHLEDERAEWLRNQFFKQQQLVFSNWIKEKLNTDRECRRYMSINPEINFYDNFKDGILLCKLVNVSRPGTIDEAKDLYTSLNWDRDLNPAGHNLILAIRSAEAIGCDLRGISLEHLRDGTPYDALLLIWQIIMRGLLDDEYLRPPHDFPVENPLEASYEDFLVRWVNGCLASLGLPMIIPDLCAGIGNSLAFATLLHFLAPPGYGVEVLPLFDEPDHLQRAKKMIKEARKLKCGTLLCEDAIITGNRRLLMAFTAHLFWMYSNNFELIREEEIVIPETNRVMPYRSRIWADKSRTYSDGEAYYELVQRLENLNRKGKRRWSCLI